MKRSSLPTIAVLTTALTLSACGGGGSSGSTTSVVPVVPTSPVVAVMASQSFQTATAPTYASNSEEMGYFNAVNAFRTSQGLGPLNQNTNYDLASAAHANYANLNTFSHFETVGLVGYTGGTPLQRVQYQAGVTLPNDSSGTAVQAGCSVANPTQAQCVANAVTEEMGLAAVGGYQGGPGVGAGFVAEALNTAYHRAGYMYQGLTDVGVSIGLTGISVSDIGYITQQANAGNYFGMYPTNGQTNVSLHPHPENPNPLPAGTDFTTVGSPISVASQETTTLKITSFTVTQYGSTIAMPAMISTSANDPNILGSDNLAFLITNQAFLPNTTYNVSFTGTVSGTATGASEGIPVTKNWSFTTGTISD